MTLAFNGEMSNEGTTLALKNVFKDQTVYMGFATVAISDTSTLATITESAHIARFDITSALGAAGVDGVTGKSTVKNTLEITSGNSTGAGEEITSYFITDALTGTSGKILAFGNATTENIFTNTGSPISIASGDLVLTID